MDNKLSELSNPKAFVVTGGKMYQDRAFTDKSTAERSKADRHDGAVVEPLYSQEYVSALIQRAERLDSMLTESVQALKETEQKSAELEQAMRHIHGALLDITAPRVAIAKAAELAVEHAAMKEQSNG
ncbi:TPA: hypothetical protein SMF53_002099 [Serratia marcescens]|nr:hypothetical protein [Serratia marcescens]